MVFLPPKTYFEIDKELDIKYIKKKKQNVVWETKISRKLFLILEDKKDKDLVVLDKKVYIILNTY